VDHKDKSAACAVYIPFMNVQNSWSIRNDVSSVTAELLGIENTLLQVYLITNLDSFTIYTDSQSAIDCIESPTTENEVAIRIRSHCCRLALAGIKPFIKWIRGHSGIVGNETAHKLANSGRTNPTEGVLLTIILDLCMSQLKI